MLVSTLLFWAATASAQTKLPPAANFKIDFQKDVQPILAQKCHSCHGDEAQQAGLRLDRRQNALRGGDYGPVIVPGNSSESKLIRRLVHGDGGLQMPPTGPLGDEEIGILRAWIDQGADFRITVEDEAPPKPIDPKLARFIAAVRSNDSAAVKRLLAESPDLVKGADAAGSTPLHHAAGFGNLAMMKLLLDKGADANAANRRKSTPLFWAIPDEAKLRLLIDRGASVNARTVDGLTPVYLASSMESGAPILAWLLEKGANPETRTLAGRTPLMAGSRDANLEVMRLLIRSKVDVNAKSEAGVTALMDAAIGGSSQAVRLLLDSGADPNFKTKRHETALAFAATSSSAETVKLLLERGVDVNVQDSRGYSALHYAAGSDVMSAEVVRMLLAKGADQSARADGETAAGLAAKRGDSEAARLLGVPEEVRKRLGVAPAPAKIRERSPAEAVQTALALLERQSHNFIRIGGCNSCHAQDLPSAAAALARERGLPAPKLIPQLPAHQQPNNAERLMDLNAVSLSSMIWELFDSGLNRVGRDFYTDATVRYIRLLQSPGGSWSVAESRRPPMNSGECQVTALSVFAIQHYGRVEDQADNAKAVARAAAWLQAAKPSKTQDRAFCLMGLAWAKASPASISAAARELAATQRADGGWNQLAAMGSDAYATGQALFALHTAGKVPVTDPHYQKGIKYLLRTQAADGSWHVKSRSIWLQPYFDSGFPYEHDQWISAAGTAWAAMALSVTVEPRRITQSLPPRGE